MQTRKSSPSIAPTLGSPSAVSAYTPSPSTSNRCSLSARSAEDANAFIGPAYGRGPRPMPRGMVLAPNRGHDNGLGMRWFTRRIHVRLAWIAGVVVVAAVSIAVALLVTPMQQVRLAGQTVGVGAAAPSFSLSGPGELDLFGQRLP